MTSPPGTSPCLAWFYSDLLTFLWERNGNLEERKSFGLHVGRRVPVVKELRSSPELVLCHLHHIAAIPKDVPMWWWQLQALWGQEAPGPTRVCTKGLGPADWVLQRQEDLAGHQGQTGTKANTESEPFCCIYVLLWLHLLLTKALHFLSPTSFVLCLPTARGIYTLLLLQSWWKQHTGHPVSLPQRLSQPKLVPSSGLEHSAVGCSGLSLGR